MTPDFSAEAHQDVAPGKWSFSIIRPRRFNKSFSNNGLQDFSGIVNWLARLLQ
jgi:hypothetical protein